MIPEELNKTSFRFIKIKTKEKAPYEKDWQNTGNYEYNNKILQSHLQLGGNYGIVTGYGNLCVIDFDNEKYQEKIIPLLPKTFTVRTGGGLKHLYYYIDNPESFKILDEQKNTMLDFQGKSKQVVAPNSVHPNGKKYEVIENREIQKINLSEIKSIFYSVFPETYLPKTWNIITNKSTNKIKDDKTIDVIKSKYSIKQLLDDQGINTSINPTKCPLHDSKGGKCLGFNDEVWHCFHCEEKGDVISLYKLIKGLDFKKTIQELCEKLNIEYKEFKNNKKKNLFQSPNWLQLLKEVEDEVVFYFDKNSIWWMWNEDKNKWEICDETDIFVELLEKYPSTDLTNQKIKNNLLNSMKIFGRKRKLKKPKPKWIQFNDKVFNIETKEFFPVSKDHFFTNPIKWSIGENSDTPIMDKFIISWVGEKYLQTMYEIIAYCLYRDYPIHRIFCFTGSGRNGKSKYLGLITKLLGDENSTTSDLDLLMSRPFESFKLYKKLVCQMGETNYEGMKRTAILKQLSGQDMISYEKKGKDGFTDYNYAKLMISTNGIPITHDKSEGFYRRWFIIDFPNNFPEGKDILKSIPNVEYENLCRKCIDLLPNLLENGEFTNEPSIEDKKRIYEEKSNPLMVFLKEKTCKDYNKFVAKFQFKDKFSLWMNSHGFRMITDSDLKLLMMEYYEDGKKRPEGFDNPIWCWIGLSWKDCNYCSKSSNCSNKISSNTYIRNEVKTVEQLELLEQKQELNIFIEEWKKVDDTKTMQELLNAGLLEEEVEKLREDGVIFKPFKDGYKLL